MKYLMVLFLLIACTTQIEQLPVTEENIEIRHEPLPRDQEIKEVEPEIFVYDEWYGVPGATFLVSDGEKAARLFLPQGKSVELPLNVVVNLEVLAIEGDKVAVEANGIKKTLEPKEELVIEDGRIIVFLDDVVIKN